MARNAISNILLRIRGEDTDAKQTLADLGTQLALFGQESATATADIKTTGEGDLAALQAQLSLFAAQDFEIDVKVKTDRSQISQLGSALSGLGETTAVKAISTGLDSASDAAKGLGQSLGGATVNLGMFGTKLGPLVAIVIALAVAVGVSLVGALSLLVTAAAGAAAAIGGLAAAFVAALGPAVLVALAAIMKIVSVVKAATNLEKARNAELRKSKQGQDQAAQAEEQRHQRILAVRDALQAVTSAERNYKQAREDARQGILDANKAQADAAQSLTDSNAQLKSSTVDAYHAMAQAARDATDALLSVKSAKLSVEEARLSVKEAANDLASFRKESGKAAGSLDNMFKKFTDVNFKGNVQQGLQSLGLNEDQALKGEALILRLRRAKLNEQEANQRVKQSEDDLAQARKKNNEFIKQGIQAYAPYRDALRAVRDATGRFAEATANANKLQKQGIDQNPRVIAAHEALINAQERLKEARRQAAKPIQTMPDDLAKAEEEFNKLSPAAQRFGKIILAIKKDIQEFGSKVFDQMAPGLEKGIQHIRNIFGSIFVGGPLLVMAKAMGDTIGNFFAQFDNPIAKIGFGVLINSGTQLIKILGSSVFPNFIKLFLRVAAAFLPALIRGANKFGKALGRWNKNLKQGDLDGTVSTVLGLMSSMWKLAVSVGKVFISWFKGSAGPAKGLLDSLTGIVNKFAEWIGSKAGQAELKKFFADVIPLAKSLLGALFQLIGFVIRLTEVIAPAATAFFDEFTTVFGIINKILGILRPFLQIAIQIGALFFGGGMIARLRIAYGIMAAFKAIFVSLPATVGKAIAAIIGRLTFLHGAWDALKGVVSGVVSAIIGALGKIGPFVGKVFGGIRSRAAAVLNFLKTQFLRIGHFIAEGFRAGLKFMLNALGSMKRIGTQLIQGIADGIIHAGGLLGKAIRKILSLLPDWAKKILDIHSPSKVFRQLGVFTIEGMEEGIKDSKRSLFNALHHTIVPTIGDIDTMVQAKRPRRDVFSAVTQAAGNGSTTIGDIVLQTPEGGTPDGLTAARKLKRELKKRG